MRAAAPAIHAVAACALQHIVGAHGLPQALSIGGVPGGNAAFLRRRALHRAQQDGKGNSPAPSCRRPPPRPHGLGAALGCGLASPTITEVVQWKIDDSLDMHQFTSLCRNIW
ncbi:hypothetical protein G6F23_014729 [Rhizopus arrhizus]|nr:hypothetical protein G6F23_014729 [Rhizopus arrhizus]